MSIRFLIERFYCGILYFFILTAFVMVQTGPAAILLFIIIIAIHFLAARLSNNPAGYLSVIRSVCKNE